MMKLYRENRVEYLFTHKKGHQKELDESYRTSIRERIMRKYRLGVWKKGIYNKEKTIFYLVPKVVPKKHIRR